jgi:capsid protein
MGALTQQPIKVSSPPPAGGPRPRLHRAQQGTTNRTGVYVDHLGRAIPYHLSHKGQIASQPRVATSRLKRKKESFGVAPDAQLRYVLTQAL